MKQEQREGVLVHPHRRLSDAQIRLVDEVSRRLLEDPGILCYNAEAERVFQRAGAKTEDADGCVRIRIPSTLIDRVLSTAPSTVVLGARRTNLEYVSAAARRPMYGLMWHSTVVRGRHLRGKKAQSAAYAPQRTCVTILSTWTSSSVA